MLKKIVLKYSHSHKVWKNEVFILQFSYYWSLVVIWGYNDSPCSAALLSFLRQLGSSVFFRCSNIHTSGFRIVSQVLCILPRYMCSHCLSCCFIAVPSCIPFLFFITVLQKALHNVWKLSDSSFCSSLDVEPCFTSDPWIRVRDLVYFICLSRGKVAQISFPKKTKKKLIASLCHI